MEIVNFILIFLGGVLVSYYGWGIFLSKGKKDQVSNFTLQFLPINKVALNYVYLNLRQQLLEFCRQTGVAVYEFLPESHGDNKLDENNITMGLHQMMYRPAKRKIERSAIYLNVQEMEKYPEGRKFHYLRTLIHEIGHSIDAKAKERAKEKLELTEEFAIQYEIDFFNALPAWVRHTLSIYLEVHYGGKIQKPTKEEMRESLLKEDPILIEEIHRAFL